MMQLAASIPDNTSFVQEALDNFAVLIDDIDFVAFFELLGIGRFQFLRHRQMFMELKSLHMALWRLALSHSFPNDAEVMFAVFLRRYARSHTGKIDRQIVERASQYWGMIMPVGEMDFSNVARHLISFFPPRDTDLRALTLRLALMIHAAYRSIFDRLI